jgi:hypothetical protein
MRTMLSLFTLCSLWCGAMAGPVTVGVSSATTMANINSSYPNPLVIVIPVVGAALFVLALAICCCSCRPKRQQRQEPPRRSRMGHQRMSSNSPYGLGLLRSPQEAGDHGYMPGYVEQDVPPPYSRSPSPQPHGDLSPSQQHRRSNSLVPTIWLDTGDIQDEESRKLLEPPSPAVSRIGSPSLQIWTPPLSPTPKRAQNTP